MITFLKANISSSIASFFDYLVTIFLVNFFRIDVVIASTTGTLCGGIINFLIGRNWVFESKNRKTHHQAIRYGIVWGGNLLLNTGGMYLMTKIFKVHYVVAKLFVSLIVGFGYNYTMQKRYVFKK
ncbi:GtrA family protein [Segetibacter koreensis]|uniref:GtrA family protein n=1 Tax=Segetibacter koreensis TaxID=398037 RepID=UPI00035EE977|nr:GtrA family protein [Segetibacter koreensis]